MPLNPTQNSLVEDFASNNILPALEDIFHKCKSTNSRQVCSYLILMAIYGGLDSKTYTKLIEDYLGSGKSSLWIKNRLIGFHQLLTQDNSRHIFVRSILDDQRFFTNPALGKAEWKNNCNNLITKAYSEKMETCLQKTSPESYNYALCLIQSEENKKLINNLSTKKEPPTSDKAPSSPR